MPIIVTFNRAIANRDFVEKALEVKSDKGDVGAWHWISDQQVVYRTQKYWQPHQNITFTAHLAGVRALRGVYGTHGRHQVLQDRRSNVTVANGKTHYMKVNHDGVVKKFPISMGMGDDQGVHHHQRHPPHQGEGADGDMVSPGRKPGDPGYYTEDIPLAVRISDRGEYVHQSPGEYYALGHSNISHGCVRTSPTGARYSTTSPSAATSWTSPAPTASWSRATAGRSGPCPGTRGSRAAPCRTELTSGSHDAHCRRSSTAGG